MNRTAFQRRFLEYNQILAKLSGSKTNLQEYQKFLDALSSLNEKISELYGNDTTPPKALNQNDIQELKTRYDAAMKQTNQYIALDNKSSLDKKRAFIAEEFRNLLMKDMEVIGGLENRGIVTLPDAFTRGRTMRLDITGSKVKTVGGMMSSRVPLAYQDPTGKIHKGFFTKGTVLDSGLSVLRAYEKKYPEYAPIWNLLETEKSKYEDMLRVWRETDVIFSGKERDPFLNVFEPETYERLASDEKVKTIIGDFAQEYEAGIKQFYTYKGEIGGSYGSSVEERNCAMSAVASLLGQNSLIGRADKVTVMNNGVPTKGCVIYQVDGTDALHIKEKDPMIDWAQNAGNGELRISNDALRQIADMQALDFICGNVDRHMYNIFYQFDKTDPQNPVLTGIVGIDNDMSFGTYMMDGDNLSTVGLNDMKVISESMADRIMQLSGDALDYAIKDFHLSDAEKEAAHMRLELLQEKIMEGREYFRDMESGKLEDSMLRIVPDQEFSNLSREELCVSGDNMNLFERVIHESPKEVISTVENGYIEKTTEQVSYTGAVLGSCSVVAMDVSTIQSGFQKMKSDLDKLKNSAMWNSDEFMEMHQALEHLVSGEATVEQLHTLCESLYQKTQLYIDKKREVPRTEKGRERLHLARELREMCVEAHEELANAVLAANDQPVANYQTQIKDRIRQQVAICRQEFLEAVQKNNKEQMIEKASEILYHETIATQLGKTGNGNLLDAFSDKMVRRNVSQVRPSVGQFLEKIPRQELMNLIETEDLGKRLHQEFLKFNREEKVQAGRIKAGEQEKQAEAEVSGPIV